MALANFLSGMAPKVFSAAQRGGSWAAAHPGVLMAGVGAVGGYMGSSGSIAGTLAGAGLGAIAGRKGWNSKPNNLARKMGGWTAMGQDMIGLDRAGAQEWAGLLRSEMKANSSLTSMPKAHRSLMQEFGRGGAYKKTRLAHNRAWSKGLQLGTVGAVGLAGGLAAGLGTYALGAGIQSANRLGSSFGGEVNSRYGATFSGMGNGIVGGY